MPFRKPNLLPSSTKLVADLVLDHGQTVLFHSGNRGLHHYVIVIIAEQPQIIPYRFLPDEEHTIHLGLRNGRPVTAVADVIDLRTVAVRVVEDGAARAA